MSTEFITVIITVVYINGSRKNESYNVKSFADLTEQFQKQHDFKTICNADIYSMSREVNCPIDWSGYSLKFNNFILTEKNINLPLNKKRALNLI